MIVLNSVLVAFDFSETSMSALTYGENLAHTFGGRLHVLHVADVIATSAAQFYPEGPGDPEVKATELAMNQLRAFLSSHADGPAATPAVRLSRSPADRDREIRERRSRRHSRGRHARPRRRVAPAHGQRRGARRPECAVSGPRRPAAGT